MDYTERNEQLQRMVETLQRRAEKDGIITSQEIKVLKKVNITVDLYDLALNKALEDGIITADESDKLKFIENTMLMSTFEMIERDTELDDDAQDLVKILFESLMNILD